MERLPDACVALVISQLRITDVLALGCSCRGERVWMALMARCPAEGRIVQHVRCAVRTCHNALSRRSCAPCAAMARACSDPALWRDTAKAKWGAHVPATTAPLDEQGQAGPGSWKAWCLKRLAFTHLRRAT